jgi:uncharacterized membrane protein YgcG
MTCPDGHSADSKKKKSGTLAWTYDLRLDLTSGVRKTEVLGHGSKKAILTTYVHALNYDSLRFIGPDGRAYMWVSNAKVSSVNGSRFDTIRHALFAQVGQIPDPLYGEIVADHTFWDGYVDATEIHRGIKCTGCETQPIVGLRWICTTCDHHDVCESCRQRVIAGGFGAQMQRTCAFSLVNLPDETLTIRSPHVDQALIIASLQVLKDWEKHTLRGEKTKDSAGFAVSEEAARKCDLGFMSYWKASDWDKKSRAKEKRGTMLKAWGTIDAVNETTSALSDLVGAGFALAGHGTVGPHPGAGAGDAGVAGDFGGHGGGHSGGGDGSGGGGGGGDSGGGG